jgi:hypothetical protein
MERPGGPERPRLQKENSLMRFLMDLVEALLSTGFRCSVVLLHLGSVVLRLDLALRALPAAQPT